MKKILTANKDLNGIVILKEKGSPILNYALPKSVNSINRVKAWLYRNGWHRTYDLEAIEFGFRPYENNRNNALRLNQLNRKKVQATDRESNEARVFESITEASKVLNISTTAISCACRGIRKNKYYDFKYVS